MQKQRLVISITPRPIARHGSAVSPWSAARPRASTSDWEAKTGSREHAGDTLTVVDMVAKIAVVSSFVVSEDATPGSEARPRAGT